MRKFLKVFSFILLIAVSGIMLSSCGGDAEPIATEEFDGYAVSIEKDAQGSLYGKIISAQIPDSEVNVVIPSVTPKNVPIKAIAGLVFYRVKLTSVVIPEGVETVESFAFGYCEGLETVELPSTITNIGEYAFANISSLKCIEIKADKPPKLGGYAFKALNEKSKEKDKYEIPKDLEIKVPNADAYKQASVWAEYAARIK